jgi:FkbM family methyltransferase
MMAGQFEVEETRLLIELLDDADVFLDVGANVGLFSCLALSRGKTVVAIDPLPANLAQLYANLQANGWENVEVYPVALGARPGLATLFGGGVGASLVPGWAGARYLPARIVPLSTLDVLVGHRFEGSRLIVKIDVEGFELEVLRGAESLIGCEPPPLWLVEVCLSEHHPGGLNAAFEETFEVFRRSGYAATTADSARRPVSESDVSRWVALGRQEFGTHNFLFSKGKTPSSARSSASLQ